eukprot:CAMPEP_0204517826 /NCGR_PEP_ID=MMETSP0661-20131031/3876_1 /ASSEMBLY_ACC=CAM_ASM_000606 /TAXON_ID=109239 /ORGANISM="Alexandrium margalefi, Strain AMGDE01CS-322" /LENGTH=36 /DNA_ID= /DNA_START= /DNA_END= /DNA_ORIENTATION=
MAGDGPLPTQQPLQVKRWTLPQRSHVGPLPAAQDNG